MSDDLKTRENLARRTAERRSMRLYKARARVGEPALYVLVRGPAWSARRKRMIASTMPAELQPELVAGPTLDLADIERRLLDALKDEVEIVNRRRAP